jgi:hypothetical protein
MEVVTTSKNLHLGKKSRENDIFWDLILAVGGIAIFAIVVMSIKRN